MKEYSKWQKLYIYLNFALYCASILVGIVLLILGEAGFNYIKIGLLTIVVFVIPLLANILFKIKISFILLVIYSSYIFVSLYLGYTFNLYQVISCFDIITHTLSGVMFVLFGIVICCHLLKINKNLNKFAIAFIGVIFSLACCFVWELVEFAIDSCLGTNMQCFIPEIEALYNGGNSFEQLNGSLLEIANYFVLPSGYKFALMDTMYDLICDIVGSIFGLIFFVILPSKHRNSICQGIAKVSAEESV